MMRKPSRAVLAYLVLAAPVAAQHGEHANHRSTYAEQADSGIAALSAAEVEQLRSGAGMGLARAAELNRYPGPKHVLELAGDLTLTAEQSAAIGRVHDQMHAEAVRLGHQILDAEESLQRRFAHRHIDRAALAAAIAEIARLEGELRFTHLNAHLQTTELLTAQQIERYDMLRGYR